MPYSRKEMPLMTGPGMVWMRAASGPTNEQMMEMTMDIYHGDELLLHRGPQVHWWLNGFKMSDTIYIPASLRMEFSIVMKDEAMVRAFCNAIKNHYRRDATYTVDGLTVSVVW